MSNLYNNISELCEKRGIKGYKLCKDTGIRPSVLTDLKMGRKQGINAETALKIADYFEITVEELYGTEKEKPAIKDDELSDDEIKFLSIVRQLPQDKRELVEALAKSLRNSQ